MRRSASLAILGLLLAVVGCVWAGTRSSSSPGSKATPRLANTEARAHSPSVARGRSRRDILPVAQIRPGMKAIGRTVFRGATIEDFDLEIVDVVHHFDGVHDIILAKITSGPVVARQTGIIAGMSGSPVYIDGKIIGAVAYGWAFPKEPIAGITPIEEMLRAWDAPPPDESGAKGADAWLTRPISVAGHSVQRVRVAGPGEGASDASTLTLKPLDSPLFVTGVNARNRQSLRKLFEPYGLQVMEGISGADDSFETPLVPGASVGVQLARGDIDITGVGTLTYRDGDRVLAFGHPMLQCGAVEFGMTAARVHDIIPNYIQSFKMASAGKLLGSITRDQSTAVAGRIGPLPKMLPVHVAVKAPGRPVFNFDAEVVKQKELTPNLVGAVVMAGIDEARGYVGRATGKIRVELTAANRPTIIREDSFYDEMDAAVQARAAVERPVTVFLNNHFERLDLQRINLTVELDDSRHTAHIERMVARSTKVEPGDTLELSVTLKPFEAPEDTVVVKLPVPKDLPRGRLRLVASGGTEAEASRRGLGLGAPPPRNLDQLLGLYLRQEKANQLVLTAALPSMGANIVGEDFPNLPAGVADVLTAARSTEVRRTPDRLQVVTATPYILTGRQMLTVTIDSKKAPPRGAPAPPPSPPPSSPPTAPEAPAPSDFSGPDDFFDRSAPDGMFSAAAEKPATGTADKPTEPRPASETPAAEKPATGTADKPVARQATLWTHSAAADFSPGDFTNIAASSDGALRLGRPLTELGRLPADFGWSVTVNDDQVYVGTGNKGEIWRVGADGKPEVFFRTGEIEVSSLLFSGGALYAGTAPHGRVYRVTPDGKGSLFYQSDQNYIWCLAADAKGVIYAGAGPRATVVKLEPGGPAKVLAQLPAAHILSLAVGSDMVYAGADTGVIYRLREGQAEAVCDTGDGPVHSLALDAQGVLYAGVSPNGTVYKIGSDGVPRVYYDSPETHVYGLLAADGALYAVTGNGARVYRINGDRTAVMLVKASEGQFLGLARADDGSFYVVGSNPTVLHRLSAGYAPAGHFDSAVLDASARARWGQIAWIGQQPAGAALALRTRSGDSSDPNDDWSPWSEAYQMAAGQIISSPAARYLQYRVEMTTQDPAVTPTLSEVRVGYLPRNRPPTVEFTDPSPGAFAAKSVEIKWKTADPDKDPLTFDVLYSADNGATWTAIKQGLTDPKYTWDTKDAADGTYRVKVVASDAKANPGAGEEAEALRIVRVDKKPPTVVLWRSTISIEGSRARINGSASDALSAVRGVDWRMDGGAWLSAIPARGVFDAREADFIVAVSDLPAGARKIEVRAIDEAGNVGTDTVTITMPAPAAPAQLAASTAPAAPAQPAAPAARAPTTQGN